MIAQCTGVPVNSFFHHAQYISVHKYTEVVRQWTHMQVYWCWNPPLQTASSCSSLLLLHARCMGMLQLACLYTGLCMTYNYSCVVNKTCLTTKHACKALLQLFTKFLSCMQTCMQDLHLHCTKLTIRDWSVDTNRHPTIYPSTKRFGLFPTGPALGFG